MARLQQKATEVSAQEVAISHLSRLLAIGLQTQLGPAFRPLSHTIDLSLFQYLAESDLKSPSTLTYLRRRTTRYTCSRLDAFTLATAIAGLPSIQRFSPVKVVWDGPTR
jgi:hypothetical protein